MSSSALETGLLLMLGAGLTVYVLLGGADFGGGVWDLVARGPTGGRQRRLIEEAIGPVWEANHVWLIFVLTGLFAAFPRAFAILGVALYLPFGLAIAGIVFRGAAFAFRLHGDPESAWVRTWTRTFGVASLITPFVLGATGGAIASGRLEADPDSPLLAAWTSPFALVLGCLMVAMCAFLAATYLAVRAVPARCPRSGGSLPHASPRLRSRRRRTGARGPRPRAIGGADDLAGDDGPGVAARRCVRCGRGRRARAASRSPLRSCPARRGRRRRRGDRRLGRFPDARADRRGDHDQRGRRPRCIAPTVVHRVPGGCGAHHPVALLVAPRVQVGQGPAPFSS